jgi:hypothetical protein
MYENKFDNFYCGHVLQNWIEIYLLISVMEHIDIFK